MSLESFLNSLIVQQNSCLDKEIQKLAFNNLLSFTLNLNFVFNVSEKTLPFSPERDDEVAVVSIVEKNNKMFL